MTEYDYILVFNMVGWLFIAVVVWGLWLDEALRFTRLGARPGDRTILWLFPPASFLPLALALAAEGLTRWEEVWLRLGACFGVGSVLLSFVGEFLTWLGLSSRDDGVERRNRGAVLALCGGQAGLGFCFGLASGRPAAYEAGAAIVVPVALEAGVVAMVGLFVVWGLLVRLTGLNEAVTVDRDGGAACRLAGALAALGLPVGAAAGSIAARAEPWKPLTLLGASAALLAIAALVERWGPFASDPPEERPRARDVRIALSYLGAAALCSSLVR
jgi:hypothetical protein